MSAHRIARSYEVDGPTVDHPQYHRGAGVSGTDWDDCAIGTGSTPAEALADATDSLAQAGWILPLDDDTMARDAFGADADVDMIAPLIAEAVAESVPDPCYTVTHSAYSGIGFVLVETDDESDARAVLARRIRACRRDGLTVSRLASDSLVRCYEVQRDPPGFMVGDDEGTLALRSNEAEREEAREEAEQRAAEECDALVYVVVYVAEESDDRDGAPSLGHALAHDGRIGNPGTVYAFDETGFSDPDETSEPEPDWIGGWSTGWRNLDSIHGAGLVGALASGECVETDDGRPLVLVVDVASSGDYGGAGALGIANRESLASLAREHALPFLLVSGDYGSEGIAFPLSVRSHALVDALQSLADYPCLDEEALSEAETDRQTEAWDSWARADFVSALADRFPLLDFDSVGADLAESEPDPLLSLAWEACSDGAVEWIDEQGGAWIDVERLADSIDEADARALPGVALSDDASESAALLASVSRALLDVPSAWDCIGPATLSEDPVERLDSVLDSLGAAPLRERFGDFLGFVREVAGWPTMMRDGLTVERVAERARSILLDFVREHGNAYERANALARFGADALDEPKPETDESAS